MVRVFVYEDRNSWYLVDLVMFLSFYLYFPGIKRHIEFPFGRLNPVCALVLGLQNMCPKKHNKGGDIK